MRTLWRTLIIAFFTLCLIAVPTSGQKGLTFLKEFTSSETITIPTNVDSIMVEMWGAGGGGGGGGSSIDPAVGGGAAGGGGGAYLRAVIPVTPGETLQVIIGKGGLGGAPDSVGAAGGDTQIARVAGKPDTTTVLIFAGGGKGGAAGVQNITTCNTGIFNAGGIGGIGDPKAGIKRNGTSGFSGVPFSNTCFDPNNPSTCSVSGGGNGGAGGTTTVGTITPPGSTGGLGGFGRTPQINFCGANQGNSGSSGTIAPGQKGKDGYAIITY